MKNNYSSRVQKFEASFIRNILKAATVKDMISFAGGLPDESLFPIEELIDISAKVLKNNGGKALQYTITQGNEELRDQIIEKYNKYNNTDFTRDNVLITSGSQQALDLISKLMLDKGDKVLLEEPSYLGAIQIFNMFESSLEFIPQKNFHPNPDGFNKDAKLMYLMPNFQNPTGCVYNEEEKIKFASAAYTCGSYIIEDDPYKDIYFDKPPERSIHSILPEQTFYLGSFSKSFSPGMRLGYIVADEMHINMLTRIKQASDLHSSTFTQLLLSEYLSCSDVEDRLSSLRENYRKKAYLMFRLLRERFPDASLVPPKGGMFIWMKIPECNTEGLIQQAIKKKVLFVPGKCFGSSQQLNEYARLNFSHASLYDIEVGIDRIADAIFVNN